MLKEEDVQEKKAVGECSWLSSSPRDFIFTTDDDDDLYEDKRRATTTRSPPGPPGRRNQLTRVSEREDEDECGGRWWCAGENGKG